MTRRWKVVSLAALVLAAAAGTAALGQGHAAPPPAADPTLLRVCADPNNLPFSDDREQGFENRVASILAARMGRRLRYTWFPQRRGFLRHTLKAGLCDVVMGAPAGQGAVLVTRPLYRSSYAFVSRASDGLAIEGLDDPRLRTLRIGVQLVGDDGENPPAAGALARRGIVDNVFGFPVYGDYARPSPLADITRAVARGEVDVSVVWGPAAGYFVQQSPVPLALRLARADRDGPEQLAFDICLGVRRTDTALRDQLDRAIAAERTRIDRVLDDHGVPRLPLSEAGRPEAHGR